MIRWPFYETSPLRQMLDSLLQEERRRTGRGEPMPVNVYEEGGAVVVEAALPGVRPEDVDVQCGEGMLTIRAQSRVSDREYLHQEIAPTEWQRQLALPADCRFDAAEADAENGILRIRIPKATPKAPETIRIHVARRGGETIEAEPGTGFSEVKPKRRPGGREKT